LIVPLDQALCLRKYFRRIDKAGSRRDLIHDGIMELLKGQVELGNNQIFIVPWIADNGLACRITRHIITLHSST